MKVSEQIRWCVSAVIVGLTPLLGHAQEAPNVEAPAAAAPAEAPATQPAQPEVSPENLKFFGEVRKAYNALEAVEMRGQIKRDIDVAGEKDQESTEFTSSFKSPNFFRHTLGDDMVVGSTGKKAFAFSTRENAFLQFDLEAGQPLHEAIPPIVASVLQQQNPSLWQVVEEDTMAQIEQVAASMTRVEDVVIDDATFHAYRVNGPVGGPTQTVLFDPQTFLIRRIVTDLKQALVLQGAPDVNSAMITIDYTTVNIRPELTAESFAWTAPEGARDVVAEADAQMAQQPSMQLKGKPAPQFEGKLLDGTAFSLADQKGKVVVLDFWATWCAPCIESLPGLHEVAAAAGDGVKVVTVNVGEDAAAVKQFLENNTLTLPIVLDPDMRIAEQYKVEPIPHQVVIDPQGNVQDVFIGSGPGSKQRLKDAIERAKAAKPAAEPAPKPEADAEPKAEPAPAPAE